MGGGFGLVGFVGGGGVLLFGWFGLVRLVLWWVLFFWEGWGFVLVFFLSFDDDRF